MHLWMAPMLRQNLELSCALISTLMILPLMSITSKVHYEKLGISISLCRDMSRADNISISSRISITLDIFIELIPLYFMV